MAVSAVIVAAGAMAASTAVQYSESRKARKDAERQADLERQTLAELQAEAEPVMPLANDRAARRRSISGQMRRRGRSSTILTTGDSGETLGA